MGILTRRKNKKFDYKPRYFKGEGNPYEIKNRFDEHRTTIGPKKNLKGKINTALDEMKTSENYGFNKTILIIIAILVLVFLLIIDFDLSIFTKPF
ncbi:riboflavin synthase subunit beta [Lutibacter sp. TH_r2]|uniref:riboflavin synthase subunit beta n=1 Tax=Lutibacter sp. TH_r2 TaxID=3082083 RepID=UPI00295404F6|nr:riboflavin synthase subunit beta [Lutibacter sp. TH_r2]MDV7188180.1 riboflavin synthase subunit beta [Lutibacter sp. TH_r2]